MAHMWGGARLRKRRAPDASSRDTRAFSRYERGEAAPLPAVVNLFRLLDKHPELLQELV